VNAEGVSTAGFIADAMLGSLARKLRVFGFDTLYDRSANDEMMVRLAVKQRRVILTADRLLASAAAASGASVILVRGETDAQRLRDIAPRVTRLGLDMEAGGPSRCALCNGSLKSISKGELGEKVPRGVSSRHRLFYLCAECGHIYWRGSHWKKLRRLQGVLRAKEGSGRVLKAKRASG
jgi:uncharacterized protein with PIN domain